MSGLNVPRYCWCCPWLYTTKSFSPQIFNSLSGSGGLQLDPSCPHNLHERSLSPSIFPSRFPLGSSCYDGLAQSHLLLLSSLLQLWRRTVNCEGKPGHVIPAAFLPARVERDNNFFLICWLYT